MASGKLTGRRIGAPKSRAGCKTCKIRKVKCDEKKPNCTRCSSTGRTCEYEGCTPPRVSFAFSALAPRETPSLSPGSVYQERRAFEFYFLWASRQLSGGMRVDFWTNTIPQICRSEPAVWDAVIAISALFEHPDQCLDFTYLRSPHKRSQPLNTNQQNALTWYSRSMSSVRSQIDRRGADPYIALISCILFICIEMIQGRVEEALQLYQQGVSLIFDLRTQTSHGIVSMSKSSLLEDTIVPLFLRLCAISLTISGVQPIGLYRLIKIDSPRMFESLDDARSCITELSTEVQTFENDATKHLQTVGRDCDVAQEMLDRQQSLKDRLANWYHSYIAMCHNLQPEATIPQSLEPVLLAYHAALLIYTSECLTQQEMVYDNHLTGFVTIVEQASLALASTAGPTGAQPPFTFEMSVGIPLFLTCMKCRDSSIRRTALHLLKQGPPMQGFFKCTPVSQLAEKIINIEESYGLALREATGDQSVNIPEEARIFRYGVFRPQDGLPPGILEEDLAKHGYFPEQLFLEFSRNKFDVDNNKWKWIAEVAPL